jgi:hypothetical protein
MKQIFVPMQRNKTHSKVVEDISVDSLYSKEYNEARSYHKYGPAHTLLDIVEYFPEV